MERTKQQDEKKPSAISDVGAWAMNVVSSVGIIMANKQLMSTAGYAFTFGQFLYYHFLCGSGSHCLLVSVSPFPLSDLASCFF